jgi:hypothetical protein
MELGIILHALIIEDARQINGSDVVTTIRDLLVGFKIYL